MKRLLFISVAPPLPANNGQRMRIWSLLRALAQDGYEIHLLTFARPEEIESYAGELAQVCQTTEAVPLTLPSWSSGGNYLSRVRGLFSSNPFGVGRFRSPEMARRIEARLLEPFSAVIADSVYSAVNLPERIGPPLIMDDNNIEHMILKRYLLQDRNPLRWPYIWLEWWKLRRWERLVCSRSALVMLCSENDRSLMWEMCPEPLVMMVPNIIDVDTYKPAPPCENTTVLYLGSMDWFPNRDAVEFFATEILPELRKKVPNVRFVVTFSPEHAPPESYRERFARTPNLELAPTNDVRREIADAAVFVVPLRIGSGTRFKILEAGAMAKPIVSTRVGAEGLDFRNGEEIVLEDDPSAFAGAVANLLGDREMRTRLGLGARQRVEEQYDFAVLRTRLADALARLEARSGLSPSADLEELRLKAAVPGLDSNQWRS
jgi:glycosyltransferase involved in cell wall biosynthesis